MAYKSKTFAAYFVCSVLLYICQSLPLDDPATTSTRKEISNLSKIKENLTVPSKSLNNIVSSTNIDNESDIKTEKNESRTDPPSHRSDKPKITIVKLKNAKDISETSLNKTDTSVSKDNTTRTLKDLTANDKFNKFAKFNRSSSAATGKTVEPLNAPEDKNDKVQSKQAKNKSDLLELEKDTVKIPEEKVSTFKVNTQKTQNSTISKDKSSSQDDKKLKVEDSNINIDPDNQLAPAIDDDLYNKFTDDDEEEDEVSKEKQINKPDFSNYSDKKVTFNKDEKYDYIDDRTGDNLQENRDKTEKVPSSNVQKTYIPNKTLEIYDDANSHFFAYLLTVMVMAVLFYLLFHNKQRIIALMIEGRGSRPTKRGARAKYHKLDNNLEEAMSSMRAGSSESTNNIY